MDPSRPPLRFFDQRLVRYLIRHCCDGIAVGWALLMVLLWSDLAGLGTLLRGSDAGALALAMLAFAFAVTFGSAAMGIAVHRLGRQRSDREPRGR